MKKTAVIVLATLLLAGCAIVPLDYYGDPGGPHGPRRHYDRGPGPGYGGPPPHPYPYGPGPGTDFGAPWGHR